MKNFIQSFFSSFFKTLATALGVVCALAFLIVFFNKPASGHTHGFTSVSNHEWETKIFSKTSPTILKIRVNGIIGQTITSEDIKNTLFDSLEAGLEKDQIKGILLCIDSPGGLASDSDTIYRLLQEYKKRYHVPIYAYTDSICASGGMLIACAADKIYSSESALIGSIGVLLPTTFNFSQLMEKIGVQSLTVTAGKCKDALNPFRPWEKDEESNIQYAADSYYKRFLHVVTENRKTVHREALIERGASIFPAFDAMQYGLIDGIVNLEEDALLLLADSLNITHEYQVIEFNTTHWINTFLHEESIFRNREVRLTAPGMLPHKLQGKFLYLYHPENQPSL